MFLVRRGPDFGGAPDRGARKDRPNGTALWADRSTDDDLDDATCGPLQSRRFDRDCTFVVGGPCRIAGSGRHHGWRRQSDAGRRTRRNRRSWIAGDGWVLQERRSNGGGLRARLASYGGYRIP